MVTARPDEAVAAAVQQFQIDGECVDVQPYQRGHIHDTFVSTWQHGGHERRFLHQRLNDRVFQDIPGLMHNIECITRHLCGKNDLHGLHTLQLVPTLKGASFLANGNAPWRTYVFLENTESYDLCSSTDQAFEAARAFGRFQADLIDFEVERLRETIPDFFSTPARLRQLDTAQECDPRGRTAQSSAELEFVGARRSMVGVIKGHLQSGRFPVRVVHGDTKLNNVLFDRATGKAACVVDLDTCMPGYSLYDFGDLVRFTAATSCEDETDLEKAGTDLQLYQALVAGYLESAGGFLTDDEVELMPFAARLVTFTIGLRFLTDYLAGDVYFKVAHPDHNLDRARVQFRMVESMESRQREMAVRLRR